MVSFVEPEYVPHDLVPSIFVSRVSGMWPPIEKSYLYYLFALIVLCGIGIGCPLTQVMNVLFVDSITDVMDQCLISITMIASTWKGINLFVQCGRIREIFQLHREMLQQANKQEKEKMLVVAKYNVRIFYFFVAMYMCGWTGVCMQTIFSNPEKRLWPSTYFLPFEFAKNGSVYIGVLLYQGISEVLFCLWNAMQDTYPIILILMLWEHVEQLQQRVLMLGSEETKVQNGNKTRPLSHSEHYRQLKECCIYYEKCLRYKHTFSVF